MNALREAGAVATDEQKARILALIEATARERAAVDSVQSALGDLNDTAKDVTGTIIRGFRDGASAAEILDSVLIKISDKLLDMALNQIFTPGPTGFLGSLLGIGGAPTAASGASVTRAVNSASAVNAARAMSASVNRVDGAGSRGGMHVTVGLRKDGLNIEPEVVSIVESNGRRIEGRVSAASRATFENYRRNQLSDDIKKRLKQPHRRG